MADAKLSVEISAETKKLEAALNKAKDQLKGLEGSSKKLGGNLEKDTESAADGFKSLIDSVENFSSKVKNAPKSVSGFSGSLKGLVGRMTGVVGSSSGLLGVISRLAKGFGVIGIAISVGATALQLFGVKIDFTSKKAKELAEQKERLAKATRKYIQSALKEKTTLNALLSIARDETISKNKRIKAVKKLNELFPKYLGNLKLEGVNSDTTKTAVDNLTKSLVQQATVKGLLGRISEISLKKFDAEQKKAKDYASTWDSITSALSFLFSTEKTYTTTQGKGSKKRVKAIKKEQIAIEELQKAINKNVKTNDADFAKMFGGKEEPKKKDKPKVTIPIKPIISSLTDQEINSFFNAANRKFKDFAEAEENNFSLDIGKLLGDDASTEEWANVLSNFSNVTMSELLELATFIDENQLIIEPDIKDDKFDEKAETLKEKLKQFNAQVKQQIVGSIAGTFSKLGETIGSGMGNAGQVLGQGLSVLLGMLADNLIQMGTAAVLASKLMASFGTITGIGAGLAAIAGGVALKAIASGINSSASGENNSVSGDTGRYSPSGGGFSNSGGGGLQNVVFEIQGTKLVGVLSNTLARNRNLGGSLGIG